MNLNLLFLRSRDKKLQCRRKTVQHHLLLDFSGKQAYNRTIFTQWIFGNISIILILIFILWSTKIDKTPGPFSFFFFSFFFKNYLRVISIRFRNKLANSTAISNVTERSYFLKYSKHLATKSKQT